MAVAAPGLLGNDTDADLDALTAILAQRPAHGQVVLGSDGSFTYTPNFNFAGSDSFTYFVNDGTVNSSAATVSITVVSVNDPPVAVMDLYSTPEDTALTVTGLGVLANDEDVDSASVTAIKISDPAHGSLTFNVDGTFSYTPTANFNGTDSFTYRAQDGSPALSNLATVIITVTAVNDPPIPNAQSVSTAEDTPTAITLTASDVEGQPIGYQVEVGPAHGSLSGIPPNLNYLPAANYTGADSFTFTARDSPRRLRRRP